MKIKSLLTVFVVMLVITCSIRTSFSLSLMDEFNNKKEWTTKELEDKLPNYIKEILDRNTLTSWESSITYYYDKKFSSSISVAYVDENELFSGNIIIEHRGGLDSLTIYPDPWKNNLYFEKKAEAFFSQITGELLIFKIKTEDNQWITIYDVGIQIEI